MVHFFPIESHDKKGTPPIDDPPSGAPPSDSEKVLSRCLEDG